MSPDWHILFGLRKLIRVTLGFLLVLGSLAPVSAPAHPKAVQSPITADGDDPKIDTGG